MLSSYDFILLRLTYYAINVSVHFSLLTIWIISLFNHNFSRMISFNVIFLLVTGPDNFSALGITEKHLEKKIFFSNLSLFIFDVEETDICFHHLKTKNKTFQSN